MALPIHYKGIALPCSYRVDFLCFSEALVELKAASALSSVDEAQLINYLRTGGYETGLLINLGAAQLGFKRLACRHRPPSA